MARREFTKPVKREAMKRSGGLCEASGTLYGLEKRMRSKSKNLRWLEAMVFGVWPDGCVQWPFAARSSGYGSIFLKGVRTTSHRVACEMAYGPPPLPGMHAAHSCNNRGCCNPAHLRWATVKENHADKISDGTLVRGEKCHTAQLTESSVREIRRLCHGGVSDRVVARSYGVSRATIYRVRKRVCWAWVA